MSKRLKSPAESKVIHLKNIPPDMTESEMVALCSPFGSVVKTLILHAQRHAFVELNSIEAAAGLIRAYPAGCNVRGTPVYIEFSQRSEITIKHRDGGEMKEIAPNNVLLVSILNLRIPVSLDNLYQVFSVFGAVLRIVTFQKKTFQALIEFGNLSSAIAAKAGLDGKDMFMNCDTLRISFAINKGPLKIRPNDPKSRDYTVPGGLPMIGGSAPMLPNPAGFGLPPHSPGSPSGIGMPMEPITTTGGPGSVLLVNKLHPEKTTCDQLFTLFGVYGNVIRVKILFQKKETAMVQFSSPQHASVARMHLNGVELHGQPIVVTTSKASEVALPASNAPEDAHRFTKDYVTSKLHRFKYAGSKNERHICAPVASLHVSNLPDGITEDELRNLFEQEAKVLSVNIFGKEGQRKMAFVKMTSVADAVSTLVRFHNHKLKDRYIRLTFSHARDKPASPSGVGTSGFPGIGSLGTTP